MMKCFSVSRTSATLVHIFPLQHKNVEGNSWENKTQPNNKTLFYFPVLLLKLVLTWNQVSRLCVCVCQYKVLTYTYFILYSFFRSPGVIERT